MTQAYAITKHPFTNLKRYRMITVGKGLFGTTLFAPQVMVPEYAPVCLVCGKSQKKHDVRRADEF